MWHNENQRILGSNPVMKQTRHVLPLALVVGLLGGCGHSDFTGITDAKPHPPAAIQKPRSVVHWHQVAADAASYVVQSLPLEREDGLKLGVYVRTPEDPTAFERAFAKLLQSNLSERGVPLLNRPLEGALVMDLSLQVAEYPDRDGYHPFEATAVATGAAVTGAVLAAGGPFLVPASLGLIAAGEAVSSTAVAHDYTSREALLQVSLHKEHWMMLGWSRIFAVQAQDAHLYEPVRKPTHPKVRIDG